MQSVTGTEREETGWRELLGPYWYKGDWLEQRAGIGKQSMKGVCCRLARHACFVDEIQISYFLPPTLRVSHKSIKTEIPTSQVYVSVSLSIRTIYTSQPTLKPDTSEMKYNHHLITM